MFIPVSPVDARVQVLGPSFTTLLGALESWTRSRTDETSASTASWDTSIEGDDLALYATVTFPPKSSLWTEAVVFAGMLGSVASSGFQEPASFI